MNMKRILSLALMALLCLLPACAMAGIRWISTAYSQSVTTDEFGGTWSYDAENRTLTLNNIYIQGGENDSYVLQIGDIDTLILYGENSIIGTKSRSSALYNTTDNDLTITGPGSLYVAGDLYGVELRNDNNLTIDGAKVEAKSQSDAAIRAYGSTIEITNGARVSIQGGLNTRGPIGPLGSIIVRKGSSFSSSGVNLSTEFYPIEESSTLLVEDTSKVTLTGAKPFKYSLAQTLNADSLSFAFPRGNSNYMTSTPSESACLYRFAVNETENEGIYTLNVQGEELNPTQHKWGEWMPNGDGTHSQVCENNSERKTTPEACSGGEATCTSKAVCGICNAEYGALDDDNHHWRDGFTPNGDGTHSRVCAYNSEHKTTAVDCSGGVATCTSKAVCGTCNAEYGTLNEDNHHWSDGFTPNGDGTHSRVCAYNSEHKTTAVDCSGGVATCKQKAICEDCGNAYGDIDPNNHNEVIIPAVAPTYTETGLTEGVKCDDCGEILVPQEAVPMLVHLPQTGDESNVILWSALAFISLFGMTMLVCKRKEV